MHSFIDMLWIEQRKAFGSGMPLWTALGSAFMPLAIAFLIFVSRNPEISQKLGLVSAKANLVAYAATDWQTYMSLFGQLVGAAGFFLFMLTISWVFGREFEDATLKDMWAVPVPRSSILLAKFGVVVLWSVTLGIIMLVIGLLMGAAINIPGGSLAVITRGSMVFGITASLVIVLTFPFAFFASVGRGYLLPIALAMLALMLTNLAALTGWGEYFPLAVPGLYAQGKSVLAPISYWIVIITGLLGILATYLWWHYADQSR
jgi:ABC-2 type transport system permease protein